MIQRRSSAGRSPRNIILRTSGKPAEDMPMDINKDGTIETPLGELKKKGGVSSTR